MDETISLSDVRKNQSEKINRPRLLRTMLCRALLNQREPQTD